MHAPDHAPCHPPSDRPRRVVRPASAGLAALALASLAAACGDGMPVASGAGPVTTDSAGVRLVQNGVAPRWTPEESWWVEETLRIGGDDAAPESLFGFVSDVAVDGEGRLYVLDQQALEIRVFGPDGAFLRTLGGPGQGPGELGKLPASVLIRGDQVWVPDWAQARVNRWDLDGQPLPSFAIPHELGARSWWRVGADGGVYVRVLTSPGIKGGAGAAGDRLDRLEDDGTLKPALAFVPSGSGKERLEDTGLPVLINAPAWAVLPGGSVAWTDLGAAEVRVLATDGSERRVRSDAWLRHAPGDAERTLLTRLMEERVRMQGGTADKLAAIELAFPDSLPVITDLHAGPEGTLWVQRPGSIRDVHPAAMNAPDPPRGWGGSAWEIFSADGAYLGSLELPPRVRVMRVGADAVIGVQSDLNRQDQVVVLALRRPDPAR